MGRGQTLPDHLTGIFLPPWMRPRTFFGLLPPQCNVMAASGMQADSGCSTTLPCLASASVIYNPAVTTWELRVCAAFHHFRWQEYLPRHQWGIIPSMVILPYLFPTKYVGFQKSDSTVSSNQNAHKATETEMHALSAPKAPKTSLSSGDFTEVNIYHLSSMGW